MIGSVYIAAYLMTGLAVAAFVGRRQGPVESPGAVLLFTTICWPLGLALLALWGGCVALDWLALKLGYKKADPNPYCW